MERFAMNVEEIETKGMRLFAARTNAHDVIRIEGSILGGENMVPRAKAPTAGLLAELLDAGTKKRSKDSIREGLAARGAAISYSAGGDRLYFRASCLPEDVSYVLGIIKECFTEASFPESELRLAKERGIAELVESKTDTRTQASGAFSRLVFDPLHPNYAIPTDTRIAQVKKVARADIVALQKGFGTHGLLFSIAGDIVPLTALKEAIKIFGTMPEGKYVPARKRLNTKKREALTQQISIKDKANVDLYLGSYLGITYNHPQYLAFVTFLSLLGGRGLSTGHLMRTIRERDGLTYGIYASLGGLEDEDDAAFSIWATFAPSVFAKGVAAIKKEIDIFLKQPLKEESLEKKKDEMVGNYLVGLSTTGGLAAALHKIGREGKSLSYIEEYPDLIRSLSLKEIKAASALLPVTKLSLAAAGTFSA